MIEKILYEYYKKKDKRTYNQDDINFAPSYFTKCKRQIFYNKTNTEASNPISVPALFKMAMGTAIHEKIQRLLQKVGIYESGEELKEGKLFGVKIKYRIDGLLNIDGRRRLLEIKTVYASGYNAIEKEPKTDHVIQLYLYMMLENIPEGTLLYIGRDNGYMIEYNMTIGQLDFQYKKEIGKIASDLITLKSQIGTKTIPEKDHTISLKNNKGIISEKFQKDKVFYKSDWQCNYCQWKDLCHKEIYDEIKKHKFYISGQFID